MKMLEMKSLILKSFALSVLLSGASVASAGTWTPLKNQPTFFNPPSECALYPNANCAPAGSYSTGGVINANLLTDGTVLVSGVRYFDDGSGSVQIWKLTPDQKGSYVKGTWTRVADLPTGYEPVFHASAILPDGRLIYEGGEYNSANFDFTVSNVGAIYDPVANTWTPVPPPPFFGDYTAAGPLFDADGTTGTLFHQPIGDSQSVVLADGRFMIADKFTRQQAILDPVHLTWTPTGAGKADINGEEGWTLLPNGKVLTIDTYTEIKYGLLPPSSYPAFPNNTVSEIYNPATGTWSNAGSTIVPLSNFDPTSTSLSDLEIGFEMGPTVLMPNGVVFATGATGYNAFYNSYTGKWSKAPSSPIVGGIQLVNGDTGAALLPNGNILVTPTVAVETAPAYIFEFDGKKFIPEPNIPDGPIASNIALLILPTGQVLEFDLNTDIEIYTPSNDNKPIIYAPFILSAPLSVSPGGSYTIKGILLNGVSQGGMYGDESQTVTNYPLVRITNLKSGHVFYSRTHDFSSMAVASLLPVTTKFDVPANQEKGLSKLEVVTNGIPSLPRLVTVK